jgi:hypothetical protein
VIAKPVVGNTSVAASERPAKVGAAVLLEPAAPVPDISALRTVSDVSPTVDFPPFAKTLSSCGLRLIAFPDVPNDFIRYVGQVTAAMLAPAAGIDRGLQDAVIAAMYRHRACCPMWKGMEPPPEIVSDAGTWTLNTSSGWEQTEAQNSVCDCIIYSVAGQSMEVVEHILHHVTDVGFHVAFPKTWGLNKESRLNAVMREAIEAGMYQVSDYEEDMEGPELTRVLLQEFGCTFSYTHAASTCCTKCV